VDTLGKLFPFLADFNEASSEFIQGEKPIIIETEHGRIAPLVCFDSIFPAFSREGVNEGATSLAVVTNDSWFFDSVGVYTHLRHSQLRAIENSRYISRAANTGISAFINEKGQIIESSEPLVQDTVYSTVYNIEGRTLYSVIGDVFVYLSILTILILAVVGNIQRNKK
jgi:apolipoprotein N-acyltransferase